jgi:ABC-type glycerol-3-phosphate transport system substrate-binding protein
MKLMLAPVFRWIVLLGLLGSLTCGCTTEKPPEAAAPNATPQGPGEVKLLVVDDGEMCAAIEQLRAEWKARTGTNIAISQASSADLIAAESLAGQPDAVIYPSRLLGALAERKWIVPLPADFASNRELAWSDTFELLQIAETNWSKTPHAVPFGSPVLTCYYRPDLLESQHKKPPCS